MVRLFKRRRRPRTSRTRPASRKGGAGGERGGAGKNPRTPAGRWLVLTLLTVILWSAATTSVVYRRPYVTYEYVPGQIVDRNIFSEVDFEYEDQAETRRRRELAARRVPPVYRVDRYAVDASIQNLSQLKQALLAGEAESGAADSSSSAKPQGPALKEIVAELKQEEREVLRAIVQRPERWKRLKSFVTDALLKGVAAEEDVRNRFEGLAVGGRVCIVDDQDRKSIRKVDDLLTPRRAAEMIAQQFAAAFPDLNHSTEKVLRHLLARLIVPDLQYDKAATEEQRERAGNAVRPVKKLVRAETLLVRRGARVTEEDLVRLRAHQEALALQRRQSDLARNVAVFSALSLLLVIAAGAALHIVSPDAFRRDSSLCLFTVCVVLQIAATRLAGDIYYHYWSSSVNVALVLPVTLAAMLLSPLDHLRTALVAAILGAAVVGMQNRMSFDIAIVAAFSSLVAGVSIRRARRRKHLLRTGAAAGVTIFVVSSLLAVYKHVPASFLPRFAGLALANGMATVAVVFALLPVFEHVFGRTTDLTLIELSDLNHPLLKRLQLEAPGTYHHSLMVATIAEQAAQAIGANPLLARVCAYFHDIGKLAHPEYFVENVHGENPHDELRPRMSSRVILNHVKEGIELARKYHLQRAIRDAIAQHHGTSLVYYFYRRALDNSKDGGVGEHDFRYPGPLPERKEITLLSLADACEAAVRSLEKPTPQKIRQQVEDIVNARIRDGQLNNSELTFHELAVAKESIIRTLTSMLHGRVKYPEEEGERGNEATRNDDRAPRIQKSAPGSYSAPRPAPASDSARSE